MLVKFTNMASLNLTLSQRRSVPDFDTHQLYTTRLVLRNLLRNENLMKEAVAHEWNQQDGEYIVDVMLGVPSEDAAIFLSRHIGKTAENGDRLSRLYEHLARYMPAESLEDVINSARTATANNVDAEFIALKGIQQGIARRGGKESSQLQGVGHGSSDVLTREIPA